MAPSRPPAARRFHWEILRRKSLFSVLGLVIGVLFVLPIGSFLVLSVSPRLFGQGRSWFSFAAFSQALQGTSLQSLLDTLVLGVASAALAVFMGLSLAIIIGRFDIVARSSWRVLVWVLLLTPTYLPALGLERIVEPGGVIQQLTGVDPVVLSNIVISPFGAIWILACRGAPFAFLAASAALGGLGREYDDAARVHGAGPFSALLVTARMISPALWSGFALVFAESISDFGVAYTLGVTANYPLATNTLFNSVTTPPVDFPLAAALGVLLIAMVGLALAAQRRALRSRSFAVLSGRTRPVVPASSSRRRRFGVTAILGAFFVASIGVPVIGIVSSSLLNGFGGHFSLHNVTFSFYRAAWSGANTFSGTTLLHSIGFSFRMAAVVATCSLIAGAIFAGILSRRSSTRLAWLVDVGLLSAVALPSLVLGASFIFAYNLPLVAHLGVHLTGTVWLLGAGYLAGTAPIVARLLFGSFAQFQASLVAAARVHGVPPVLAWFKVVLPLLARPLMWAWLVAFGGIALELPVSQILEPPGSQAIAVAITSQFQYGFQQAMAMTVIAVGATLLVMGAAALVFRIFAPASWRSFGLKPGSSL
ncbi:MAG TPA: ABC transporter permease subunit [Acidimicrobiales bacterium]|nr:ABC transporter permease subunit [Acidimicrobiales bacterium]